MLRGRRAALAQRPGPQDLRRRRRESQRGISVETQTTYLSSTPPARYDGENRCAKMLEQMLFRVDVMVEVLGNAHQRGRTEKSGDQRQTEHCRFACTYRLQWIDGPLDNR